MTTQIEKPLSEGNAHLRALARITVAGVSVLAIGLAIYAAVVIGFAWYEFSSTKAALMSRGLTGATASLIAWIVMLVGCALPMFALARVVLGRPRVADFAFAMVGPLMVWGITLIPANFDTQSQKTLRWCAPARPDGTKYCSDGPGRDPITGRDLMPMDEKMAVDDYRRTKGLIPKLIGGSISQATLFDPISGEPKAWYASRLDGCFDLFDQSGTHPVTGERLREITPAVVKQALQCESQMVKTMKKAAVGLQTEAAPTPVLQGGRVDTQSTTTSQINDRSTGGKGENDARSKYIDLSVVLPGAKAVAFRGDPSLVSGLIRHLPQPVSISVFTNAFYQDGVFDQTLLGDTAKLRAMNIGNVIDTVYLIRVSPPKIVTFAELEGITQAQVAVSFAAVDPRTGAVIRANQFDLEGKGFSPQKALANLRTDIDKKATGLFQ